MGDQDTADELAKEASGTAVTIGSDVTSGAPLVTLTAEAKNPQQAVDALTVLNRKSVAALAKLQSRVGVPSEALITSLVLTQDTRATANHKRQLQMTIMLGIGTLVVALLLLALADGYLLTRRSSAEGRRTGSQARKSSSRATRKVPTEGPS